MQGINGTPSPLGVAANATSAVPGACPSNPPGLAVVRSLSPPSDSNPGSSCTGVSSSTANNGTTNNGVGPNAVASPAGTSPLTSPVDGGPTAGSLLLGARQLNKVKRFLTTLQQFASDVAPDVGERVHALILGLVSSTISIEDFHQSIQEITNYPLRPFVVPFLKSHLPLLQTEVLHYARAAKQSPSQYLRQHEQQLLLLLDPLPGASEPPPFGDIFFQPETTTHRDLKRRTSSANLDRRPKENGHCSSGSSSSGVLVDADIAPPSAKRPGLSSPNTRLSPAATAAHTFRFDDVPAVPLFRDRFDRFDRFDRDPPDRFYRQSCYGMLHRDYPEDRDMEDEWKNINTMLNCILGMVEKTKRALAILQHRSQAERHEFPSPVWPGRRHMDDLDIKKRDLMTSHHHYKAASAEMDRVSEVRRRAEEAVHEVKRQAVAELQKAVSAAESKASELVASERTKMERLIGEARRQAAEEALAAVNHQEDSTEQHCWNCGRKASETCSGCNVARYCGAFCQHKDWENHHRVCGQQPSSSPSSSSCVAVGSGKRSPSPPTAAPTRRTEAKADVARH